MFLLTTYDPPTLPQGENSYPTCQRANMFGMFSHIHCRACDPANKKIKVSYYFETYFQEIKTERYSKTGKPKFQEFKCL